MTDKRSGNNKRDARPALAGLVSEAAVDQRLPRLVPFSGLKALGVPYSKRQLDRLEASNKFPKRVPIGESRVGWITAEIVAQVDGWIARRTMDAGKLGNANAQGNRDNSAGVRAATAARQKRMVAGKHKRERRASA